MKTKYSAIWLHFDDEDGRRAKCNHCNASISFFGGCHGNLRRHLRSKHSIIHLNDEEKKVLTSEEDTTFEETIDELLTKEHFDEVPSTSSQATTVTRELEESVDSKPKRKYSVIWLHFKDIGGQRAKCNYCNASISFFGGCHGNLRRHLKLKHSLTQLNLEWKKVTTSEEETNLAIEGLTKEHFDELPSTSTEVTTGPKDNQLQKYIKFRSRHSTKRKYSAVWLHFEEKGGQRAKCNICKATLSISGGSHGNLRRHLKLKHSLSPFHVKRQKMLTSEEETNFEETIDELPAKEHFDELPTTSTEVTTETQENQLEEYTTFRSPETSKRKFSTVWLHFEEKDGQRAKCKICNATLSIAGGCHGNLRRHLKSKHSLTFLNLEKKKLLAIKTEVNSEETIDEWPAEEDFKELPSTSKQENQLEEYLIGPSPICEVEQIDRQVLKMLVKGHHSFRLVEDPEFKKLINDVSNCAGYTLPSKEVLSHSLFPRIYLELLEEIKRKLQVATAVCLTTDGWTSKTNVNYLAVTAHYINTDTEHTTHLLACGEFKNEQTANNFFNFLNKVVYDFQINDKITAVVNNNSPSITDAIRLGEWQEIRCFANSLNLIIQAAINEIADTTNKVKEIIEHLQKSDDAFKKLLTAEKATKLSEPKLKHDNSAKWNSIFEMLLTINRMRDVVTITLPSNRPELMLTVADWEIIEEAIPILKPFYETATEISREKNVTLGKVLVMFNLLESCIFECVPFNEKVTSMVTNLQSGLASRLENLEKVSLYAESIILDPRFKRKGFKSDASYEEAVWNLRNKICNITLPNSEEVTSTTLNLNAERESIWDAFDLELNMSLRSESNASACMREFDKYIDEDYLDRKCDPLIWWKKRQHIYPRLYSYALKCLCVVASSTPCEQIFTTTGQMISERRAFSKTNKFGKLLFLYHNM